MTQINVLLIEDDPMVREVNRQFIEKVAGFEVIGQASNGVEGIEQICSLQPDLVFMDIFMPEQDGLTSLRKIRELKIPVDVITVTAANDMETVKQVLHLGVFDYIMKPFSFERVQGTLENYKRFKQQMQTEREFTQGELDQLFHYHNEQEKRELANEEKSEKTLPKGFNRATLEKVVHYLQSVDGASAEDVASGVGIARVTARRYLDYLEKQQEITMDVHYGGIGRPINYYFSK
ncbi:response regulator [Lysinibacillus sphaericus]|uniref:DNA-binding response regulator n=4 Tax=Lysinibacillus TaxID=400634 RepID=A0A2S0JYM0_LYSSH|nr:MULTISPECIES: response regulator [Lysinibacillus]AHN22500.1 regulator [Lysinibacillus varians]AVK96240.1 DNA-binding response regulator [Lysinibacillus sphaericus]MED4544474.1 response regulator [Lysinibacillus sphaericus]TKI18083.1 response regulator [Lysinibacillus sphaericus]TKI50129.1 response regulator [Lysinibacillus tabacifolii]